MNCLVGSNRAPLEAVTVVPTRDDGRFDRGGASKDRDTWADLRLFLELLFRCGDGLSRIFLINHPH